MKNIKKLAVLIMITGFVIAGFQSCSQYPDNSGITLVTRNERVAKTWKVDNYKVNDVDYTSLLTACTETFTTQGNYSFQWAILGGTGSWSFQNNYAEIKINGVDNLSSKTLFILKLEEKSFLVLLYGWK